MIIAPYLPAIIGPQCVVEGKAAMWVELASMTIAKHLPAIIGVLCPVEGKVTVWVGLALHDCCPAPTSHHRCAVSCRRQCSSVGLTSMTIAQHLPTSIGGQCAVEGKVAV